MIEVKAPDNMHLYARKGLQQLNAAFQAAGHATDFDNDLLAREHKTNVRI